MSTTQRNPLHPIEKGALIERCARTCAYCGRQSSSYLTDPDGNTWHIDHQVPVSAGGSNNRINLVLACAACNASKAAALPMELLIQPGERPMKAARIPSAETRKQRALRTLQNWNSVKGKETHIRLSDVSYSLRVAQSQLLQQIEAGAIKAVRRERHNFQWCLPISEAHRLLEEQCGFTVAQLLAELAEVEP